MDETSLRDTFAPHRAIWSVWPGNQVMCDLVQKFKPKTCFLEKRIREGFSGKIEPSFRPEQFCPRTYHIAITPRKEVCGRFHQKIPTENMFFRMDETSLRDTFAPHRPIWSVWPGNQVMCNFVQKFKPKTCFLEKRNREGFSGKIEPSFRLQQFCPRTYHIANQAQKRGMEPV